MAMATTTYEMEAMIRGYHVYATVWLNTFFLALLVPRSYFGRDSLT